MHATPPQVRWNCVHPERLDATNSLSTTHECDLMPNDNTGFFHFVRKRCLARFVLFGHALAHSKNAVVPI